MLLLLQSSFIFWSVLGRYSFFITLNVFFFCRVRQCCSTLPVLPVEPHRKRGRPAVEAITNHQLTDRHPSPQPGSILKYYNKMASNLRIALVQMAVGEVKTKNVARAVQLIKEAAGGGAQLVVLPECFNSPYGTNYFPKYAEPIPGESTTALGDAAKKFGVFVVGGSVPEREGDKLYNTCTVWGPQGTMLAKHRKVHLFDINVPGGQVFRESDCLSPGSSLTTFDLPHCKIGLGICYDMRFPEPARIYAKLGCKVVLYPGAFNMTTGPAHWELLQRCRAVDNQVYVGTVSPARDTDGSYIAWGHSSIVNPWGEVISTCEDEEAIIYGDLDMDYVNKVRQMVPVLKQMRDDVYEVTVKQQQES